MSEATTLKVRTIAGREVHFRELTVGEARSLFGSDSDDIFGGLLFPGASLSDLAAMTNLAVGEMDEFLPSQIHEVIKGCREMNPDFFALLERLGRARAAA
ncbi:hypothetical protein QYE80_08105 [Pseudomonas tohonis]|nr:hypothetical protein L682_27310 [Pseudomonas alcaligenes OT 69]MDN4144937.1 hypothetical protein [Pseudomonas tohonis]